MNTIPMARKVHILACLAEGMSTRSTERITETHRDTIMRLSARVGAQCLGFLDQRMRGLTAKKVQVDEIWTYVQKKEKWLTNGEQGIGDQYVFLALDADTKLVPCFLVGKRISDNAHAFMQDLAWRVQPPFHLTTDGFRPYLPAVEAAFGSTITYGMLNKSYRTVPGWEGRYSPGEIVHAMPTPIIGRPDPADISTSYVERQNLTMRMQMRRFTRLTNGFSKTLAHLKAALGLHFAHYNFLRVHRTLRMTPAMAAGLTDHIWTWEELLGAVRAN